MRMLTLLFSLSVLSATASAQESAEEIKSYCEKAAVVMQLPDKDKAAYIQACIENRTEELSDSK